jgi:hypothetical protein
MLKQVLTQFPFTTLVLVGQLIFFAVFIGALGWVVRSGSDEAYEYMSGLPFRKGESDEQ